MLSLFQYFSKVAARDNGVVLLLAKIGCARCKTC